MVKFFEDEFEVKGNKKDGGYDRNQLATLQRRRTRARIANYVLNIVLESNGEVGEILLTPEDAYEKGISDSHVIFEESCDKLRGLTAKKVLYQDQVIDGIPFTNFSGAIFSPSIAGWKMIATELGYPTQGTWTKDKIKKFYYNKETIYDEFEIQRLDKK